jgi:predicted F0F1-ATPase subunit
MPEDRRATSVSFWQAMGYLTSLGWVMAIPIAGGVLLGRYLDGRLGTGSTWTLLLLMLGMAIAALEAYLAMRVALRRRNHHEPGGASGAGPRAGGRSDADATAPR